MAIGHVERFGPAISMGLCATPDPIVPAITSLMATMLKFPVGYRMIDVLASIEAEVRGHADPNIIVTSSAALEDLPVTFNHLRGPNTETKVQIVI